MTGVGVHGPNDPTLGLITYRGPRLTSWQHDALGAWWSGDSRGPHRGTLEVFTGGGKTLLALAAAARLSQTIPDLRIAVVVPTQALQAQWIREIAKQTDLPAGTLGRLGGGRSDSLADKRVLVSVLNSASTKLADACRTVTADRLLLIVDECHRAGAPQFSKALQVPAQYRMGLSATPDRGELDESGEQVSYDEHVLGRELGEVVFNFDLRKARAVGWLPDYRIYHHGVTLSPPERQEYERISRQVDDLADKLRSFGREPTQARRLAGRTDDLGRTAAAYVGATALRKDLLYRASERHRVTVSVLEAAYARDPTRRTLLFHERVDQAVALHQTLSSALTVPCALEHSKLAAAIRRKALADFADGSVSVLVSVKSLVEGINVPASDVGVSVASSSSVRQRVQSLGRVLRRRFDDSTKRADMHIVYVADSVDELIYAKEDWSDLTGGAANTYLLWPLDATTPERLEAPPRNPRPTEEMEWQRLGECAPTAPEPWLGVVPDGDYSIDTRGTILTPGGQVVRDGQGVAAMLVALRGTSGGRFKVTPRHRLVIAFAGREQADAPARPYVLGQLDRPFDLLGTETDQDADVSTLAPGDPYPGPLDKTGGTFKLRQKGGGVLERALGKRGGEFADPRGEGAKAANARRLIDAWRATGQPGLTINLNGAGHIWYLDAGQPRYLTTAIEGFAWPSEQQTDNGEKP